MATSMKLNIEAIKTLEHRAGSRPTVRFDKLEMNAGGLKLFSEGDEVASYAVSIDPKNTTICVTDICGFFEIEIGFA